MSYLSLRNINKIYPGNVQAVFDFSLDVEEGEFIVLVGPSGCGKSTILRMIAGLEEISSGEMLLENKRINDMAPSDREVAMVFQDYALYGNMTVYQNIGFSLNIKGEEPDMIHDRVMEVSRTVQLYDYLNRFPKALSGGQKQRVSMGRSLAKQAKLLLMDEPLSNLDAKLRQQTRMELSILQHDLSSTIVFVTHDQIEAMTLADRIVILKEGHIQQIGTPYEVYHRPANIFTASFIGMPPVNLIPGAVEGNRFTGFNKENEPVLTCKVPEKIAAFGKSGVTLGIRPENISMLQPGEKADNNKCLIKGKVATLEFLGAEMNAGFDLGDFILNSRIPPHETIQKGDNIEVVLDISEAHFFDKKTGLRLEGQSL
jgi:multiple sugar transport system ATP-binding protein